MKVLQILFIALVLAFSLAPAAPVALAVDCGSVTYSSTGAATYKDTNGQTVTSCDNSATCPDYAGIAGTYPCAPSTASGLLDIINKVFTTMFIFLVTIASFTLLYAAFLYVTSEGEQEKINQAKKIIIYAVIALIVAALAFGAPRAIQTFITG